MDTTISFWAATILFALGGMLSLAGVILGYRLSTGQPVIGPISKSRLIEDSAEDIFTERIETI